MSIRIPFKERRQLAEQARKHPSNIWFVECCGYRNYQAVRVEDGWIRSYGTFTTYERAEKCVKRRNIEAKYEWLLNEHFKHLDEERNKSNKMIRIPNYRPFSNLTDDEITEFIKAQFSDCKVDKIERHFESDPYFTVTVILGIPYMQIDLFPMGAEIWYDSDPFPCVSGSLGKEWEKFQIAKGVHRLLEDNPYLDQKKE